ncbi:MAG: ArnT family glycosyltransferase [Cyclobacteriaceae bacterium]
MKKNGLILLGFILLSVLVRIFTFYSTVLSHDESTYLVIAQELLRGKLLYKDLLDIKPIGIYALFAGIITIHKSIFFIRLVATILVAATAFLLYKVKYTFSKHTILSLSVGAFYIFALTTRKAVSPNTEVYFVFFSILGLYFLAKAQQNRFSIFLAGLSLGIGFIIKYVVLFDFIFLSIYFFILLNTAQSVKGKVLFFLKNATILFIGLIIPFLAVHLYFYQLGIFEEFLYMTYQAPLRYSENRSFLTKLDFAAGIHKYYLVFMILFYLSLLFATKRKEMVFTLIWFVVTLFGVSVMGGGYHHYMVQCMPAACFIGPNLLFQTRRFSQRIPLKWSKPIAFLLVLGTTAFTMVKFKNKFYDSSKTDINIEIATYINTIKQNDETLFVSPAKMQVINFLTSLSTPDRVIHPTNYTKESRKYTFNINLKDECNRIWNSKPTYILADKETFLCSPFYSITDKYTLVKKFRDHFYLYKIQ